MEKVDFSSRLIEYNILREPHYLLHGCPGLRAATEPSSSGPADVGLSDSYYYKNDLRHANRTLGTESILQKPLATWHHIPL